MPTLSNTFSWRRSCCAGASACSLSACRRIARLARELADQPPIGTALELLHEHRHHLAHIGHTGSTHTLDRRSQLGPQLIGAELARQVGLEQCRLGQLLPRQLGAAALFVELGRVVAALDFFSQCFLHSQLAQAHNDPLGCIGGIGRRGVEGRFHQHHLGILERGQGHADHTYTLLIAPTHGVFQIVLELFLNIHCSLTVTLAAYMIDAIPTPCNAYTAYCSRIARYSRTRRGRTRCFSATMIARIWPTASSR
jgi:hypothetical protein